jgi:hypothetical protein
MWVQPSLLSRFRAPNGSQSQKALARFRGVPSESDRTAVRWNVDAEAPDPGFSAPDVER